MGPQQQQQQRLLGTPAQQHHMLVQQQQQQLLNQEFMAMQHQAQHSKKLRRNTTSAYEQQFMQTKMNPQSGRKHPPTAALLQQSSIVTDPNKMGGDLYGSGSILRSSDLLHKNRMRMLDGRPYSPSGSPDIDLISGMRPGPAANSFLIGGTPITTPMGTPAGTPRGGARDALDSPDNLSETDSQASLRGRRKLPLLPPDQEAALLPSVQKKKMELAKSQQQQLATVQERIKAYSNMRQGSLPESYLLMDRSSSAYPSVGASGGLTRPTSETNLRQLAYGDGVSLAARPGSAMGLLQGSSIVNANGMRFRNSASAGSGVNYGALGGLIHPPQKSEDQTLRESLAAILPPDLRHLVGSTAGSSVTTNTTVDSTAILNAGGIRAAALEDLRGSPLTRRRALEEELQRLTEDRSRFRSQTDKDHERELRIRRELDKFAAMRDPLKRFDQRRPSSAAALGSSTSMASVASGTTGRLRKGHRGHRRQLSDPRISSLMMNRSDARDALLGHLHHQRDESPSGSDVSIYQQIQLYLQMQQQQQHQQQHQQHQQQQRYYYDAYY